MCNNAQWITFYIILNSIVEFLFVLKSHNYFRKKVKKKKRNVLLGLEPGTSDLRGKKECTARI